MRNSPLSLTRNASGAPSTGVPGADGRGALLQGYVEGSNVNVVEEMALASGIPVPRVFVLEREEAINAFAAGYWLLPPIWQRASDWRVLSQPEYFAKAFGSEWLGTVVAPVGCVALLPYLVLQLKGLGIIVAETSYGAVGATAAILVGLTMTLYSAVYLLLPILVIEGTGVKEALTRSASTPGSAAAS